MSLPINQVILGDCGEVMAEWPGNSVDCVVTDPPYRIGFMGKSWDRALPPRRAFRQILRVLKPGALAFIMSSPRQDVLWRMLSMLDEIGFELKTSAIFWIYRTGFPKAYDVSKGIEAKLTLGSANWNEFRKLRKKEESIKKGKLGYWKSQAEKGYRDREYHENEETMSFELDPKTEQAKQWVGWKSQTGLKPAAECILMVNKPRSEPTIVDNVLRWGTGAVNVDACRIPFQNEEDREKARTHNAPSGTFAGGDPDRGSDTSEYRLQKGRFPANLLVSDGALDTGETTGGGVFKKSIRKRWASWHETMGRDDILRPHEAIDSYGDEGSPFRFFDLDAWAEHHGFLDVAKPSRAERDFGLWGFEMKPAYNFGSIKKTPGRHGKNTPRRNIHSTVKPVKLMAYLIELGCPPEGIIVDPFLGSGTTCIAAKRLRRKWIGIEINPEYAEIAEARINIRGPLDQFMESENA